MQQTYWIAASMSMSASMIQNIGLSLSLSLGVDFLRSIPYHYQMLKMVQYNFALIYTSRIGVVNGVSEAIATAFRPRRLFNRSFFG